MATTPTNNLKKRVKGTHEPFKLGANASINQGDLVTFIGGANNHYVQSSANDADSGNQVGVALQTVPVTSIGAGDGNNRAAGIEVGWGDVFTFKTTANDTYSDGDKVYLGADAQTVTSTQNNNTANNAVGYVKVDPNQGANGTITGGSGVYVDVEVLRIFPSKDLT